MPDLSNLLGAVYGDGPSKPSRDAEDEAHVEHEPAADERGPAVPDWADDEHLDAAFAEWKPGPSTDASPAEHAFVVDGDDDPAPPLADDLAAALSEALVAASGTVDDTPDAAPELGTPKQSFDFTAFDDEPDEPVADEPEGADEPANLSKSEVQPLERAETEQSHDLGEVQAAEPVHELDQNEPEPEPVHELDQNEPEPEPQPSITPQRAAAAELTAASRIDPEPVAETPAPIAAAEPEPTPAARIPLPTPAVPKPAPVSALSDGGEAPTTLLSGTRRWERSDDDILPEKLAKKKFFSFSLRRG